MLYAHVCHSRSRLYRPLCLPWACAYWSLRPFACVVTSGPFVGFFFLDVIAFETHPRDVGLLDAYHFSTSCDVMHALLALCHPFGSLCLFTCLHAWSNGTVGETRGWPFWEYALAEWIGVEKQGVNT